MVAADHTRSQDDAKFARRPCAAFSRWGFKGSSVLMEMREWATVVFTALSVGCGGATTLDKESASVGCRPCQAGSCPADIVAEHADATFVALLPDGVVVADAEQGASEQVVLATTHDARVLYEGRTGIQQLEVLGREVYWLESDSNAGGPTIRVLRASIDNPGPEPEFVVGGDTGPTSFALDESGLYFAKDQALVAMDRETKTIRTVAAAGGLQIAIDDSRVYWPGCSTGYSSVKKDGTDPETVVATSGGPTCTYCLTVDAERVYVSDGFFIAAFRKGGSQDWVQGADTRGAGCNWASNGKHLYFATNNGIRRIPVAGGTSEDVSAAGQATAGSNFTGVRADADCLYWADPSAGKVYTTSTNW